MFGRKIAEGVSWVGAEDWNRRLFDALIPLPDGTSYNAYLVQGSEKTALLDTVDPAQSDVLLGHLAGLGRIDYIVAHHAEQDHSGCLPLLLERFPEAVVVCSPKAREMLSDLLDLPSSRFLIAEDGRTLPLGGKTLTFIHTPWVHWPETMCSYLQEDRILFSCDLFGSHVASSDLFVTDQAFVCEAAKRYYAEIMMPFRAVIRSNIERLMAHEIRMIAPSHGPIYDQPRFILAAYREWISDEVKNEVVIPYVSMHGSTKRMVDCLQDGLTRRGITVHPFDITVTDIGKLAIRLVDAATVVVGTPTVHGSAHPQMAYVAHLTNSLRPKARYAAFIGSYGWRSQAIEHVGALMNNLKIEILGSVICRGFPRQAALAQIEALACLIADKHATLRA